MRFYEAVISTQIAPLRVLKIQKENNKHVIDFEKRELSPGFASVFSIDVDNKRNDEPSQIDFKDKRVQRLRRFNKNTEPPPTQDEIDP